MWTNYCIQILHVFIFYNFFLPGAKKVARKRQKTKHKKHRGRKRQLKYVPDIEVDSSSFTDCTDEDIIRDYIENITANLSDSDVDSTLTKGAFLVKRDFSSPQDFRMPWSPEVDETDSYNESFLLTQSRKKRRRYKRHNIECLTGQPMQHISADQQERIHNVLMQQYSRFVCVNNFIFILNEATITVHMHSYCVRPMHQKLHKEYKLWCTKNLKGCKMFIY